MRHFRLLLALAALALAVCWFFLAVPPPSTVSEPSSASAGPDAPGPGPAAGVQAPFEPVDRASANQTDGTTAAPQGDAFLVVRCVSRPGGEPVAGAWVHVRAVGAAANVEPLQTGSDGRARFEVVPSRAWKVGASEPSRFLSVQEFEVAALSPGETREVEILLEAAPTARFCALVIARETGVPIADALVALEGTPTGRTDRAGRFELEFVAHRTPWIRVEASGFGAAIVTAVAGHETQESARRIELARAASLEVQLVIEAGDGLPSIELRGRGHDLLQEGAFSSSAGALPGIGYESPADATHVCRFDALPPNVRFDARVIGASGVLLLAAEPIVLAPGEHRRLEWDLRGIEIVGRVLEADGSAAGEVGLWLLRGRVDDLRYADHRSEDEVTARARSDGSGSFRFPRVLPGTWVITPKPVDEIAGTPHLVVVERAAERVVVDVRLSRGIFVRGRLVAPDGTTGVQGWVTSSSSITGSAGTAADGSFVLGPLAPGKVVLVGNPFGDFVKSAPLEVDPPAEGVVLRALPGAIVEGRVVDETGAGVQAAITVASAVHGSTLTRTQPDGDFRFSGLEPGEYVFFATTREGRAGLLANLVLAVDRPLAELRVVLAAGASVRVRNERDVPATVWFRVGGVALASDEVAGRTNLTQVVPPGPVVVEHAWSGDSARLRTEVVVARGGTSEAVLAGPPK